MAYFVANDSFAVVKIVTFIAIDIQLQIAWVKLQICLVRLRSPISWELP